MWTKTGFTHKVKAWHQKGFDIFQCQSSLGAGFI